MIPVLLFGLSAYASADLPATFHAASETHHVPEKVLLALSYEASHWRVDAASAWGGYGLFDLREPGEGGVPLERASVLADLSPDVAIHTARGNVDAAAAWLAWQARLSNDGQLPPQDDLVAWWDAVRAFSGRHEPNLQDMYASYVFELINFGVDLDVESGLSIAREPVNHWALVGPAPPTACDYSGCSTFTAAYSGNYSNYSRGAADISYVIVHTVQGSYSGCISWFQNSSAGVSAHYVVRSSDGQVTQMVAEEDVAWHAGNWSYNEASVGIEHEGYVDDPGTWYTTAMYAESARLTADILDRNGIPVSRSYVLAHSEVPGATHTDPGSGWDWDYYMTLLGDDSGSDPTGGLIGVIADTDIYNGARLVGAEVWIEETGDEDLTDGDGYYTFDGLPLGEYTVHACMDGYNEATCTKSISTGDNWCSMALQPGVGCAGGTEPDPDPVDTGTPDVDTGVPDDGDGGAPDEEPEPDPDGVGRPRGGDPPGVLRPMSETRGCAVVGGGVSLWAGLLGMGAVFMRRRR